jgi:hypothetical protein
MGTAQATFVENPCGGSRGSDHCACLTGSDITGSHVTFPLTFPPYFAVLFFPYFFFLILFFFSYFFPYFFPRTFFPYFFFVLFPVLFYRTFSNVATFEIQRFKISLSCFSSTCRYYTVHVPCGISIQTSPVGLSLDGWGARMRDLKGSKMYLFNLKED